MLQTVKSKVVQLANGISRSVEAYSRSSDFLAPSCGSISLSPVPAPFELVSGSVLITSGNEGGIEGGEGVREVGLFTTPTTYVHHNDGEGAAQFSLHALRSVAKRILRDRDDH
jgi:hypothetical protein